MTSPARIYVIANRDGRAPSGAELPSRLVRAPNASQALRHVVTDTLACAVATQDDLVRLLCRGVQVEDSKESAAAD